MRVFVFTDNLNIYQSFGPLLQRQGLQHVAFHCSVASRKLFEKEIEAGTVSPLSLRDRYSTLVGYDLGLSCHSKQIFPAELVHKVRCINIHPGFNPYNRGWYPQAFSLINKLPAGATIHEMDDEIDHGPIICQEKVEIYEWDTSLSVYNRVQEKEVSLFREWLPKLLSGDYRPIQPSIDGNYNGKGEFANLCKIDLDRKVTFKEAIDYLRAMSHPPFLNAYYESCGRKVFIRLEVTPEDEKEL
jgi:methionyl-tRNA formyltransferase